MGILTRLWARNGKVECENVDLVFRVVFVSREMHWKCYVFDADVVMYNSWLLQDVIERINEDNMSNWQTDILSLIYRLLRYN